MAAGSAPVGIAVSPDGKSVYVTNFFSPSISEYDVATGGVLTPRARPRSLRGPAIRTSWR